MDKIPSRTSKIMVWAAVDFTATRSASSLATPVRTSSSLVSTLVLQNQTFVALFTVISPKVHSSRPTASFVFDRPRVLNRDGYNYPREINRHLPVHLHFSWTIRLTIPFSLLPLSLPSIIFTGQSKGFGFAQFPSIEAARAFVEPQFPFIQVPPPASHGASATTAFYKALKTGGQHSGRRVKIDYSQSANPNTGGRSGRMANANDGTRDIGNSPAAILLFRGLDPLSGPQAIELAMTTSSGPHKEGAKGMKRIVLIKDKTTLASWGFAFVEFVDVQVLSSLPVVLPHAFLILQSFPSLQAASAVLAATMSPQIHPNGFRISDRPVATSFAHPYSFQPVSDPIMRDEACLPSSMTLGGVEDQWVRYWDEGATIAKLEYEAEIPTQQPAPTKEKEKKKKKGPVPSHGIVHTSDFEVSVADVASAAPAEASTLPVSDKPVTLSFKGGSKPTNLTSLFLQTPFGSAFNGLSRCTCPQCCRCFDTRILYDGRRGSRCC